MKPAFSLPNSPPVSSFSSLISAYLHRAQHVYASIYTSLSHSAPGTPQILDLFSISSPSTDKFLTELAVLSDFLDNNPYAFDQFAALELTGLTEIAAAFGRTSDQYILAARTTRAMLESALSQYNLHLVLLTFDPTVESESIRQARDWQPEQTVFPSPQQPISAISTCFQSEDACSDATDGCSGRGQCMEATKAGRTCFVCTCNVVITDEGKRETWVGDACQRKDVSA